MTQSLDLGLSKKYKLAGDGAIAVSTNMPAMGAKADGFVGIDRYVPVLEGVLNTPHHKRFLEESTRRLKEIDPSGPLPDRYVQSNYEAVNALKIGMQKSGFRGKEDTMKLIEALEGLEMKEGDDFPQGDKLLRKEDHQAFLREFIFEIQCGKYKILDVIPKEKTLVPRPAASSPERDRERRARPAPPPPTAGAPRPILRTEGLTVRFGGLTALNNVNVAVVRGARSAPSSAPTAPGKSTFFNCLTGVHPAERRAVSCSTATTSPGCRPTASRASRWRARTRSPTSCPAPRCWRTCASPPSRAGTRWSLLRHHRAYTDVIDRARAVLDSVGLARQGRTSWPPTSRTASSATSRSASRSATEPKLLCLDEPTAGMSVAETHATVELVRRIAADLTILIVEHDMEVVMGLARTHHRAELR